MADKRKLKPQLLRVCDVCRVVFASSQPMARRCSEACQQEHKRRSERDRTKAVRKRDKHLEKMQKLCVVCGEQYRRIGNSKTCSEDCSVELKRQTKQAGHIAERAKPDYQERRRQLERDRSTATSEGFAYVLVLGRVPGECKIGFALDIAKRLEQHQCTRYDVEMAVVFTGGRRLELWLHDYFSAKRIDREWFAVFPEDVIEAVKAYPLSACEVPFG